MKRFKAILFAIEMMEPEAGLPNSLKAAMELGIRITKASPVVADIILKEITFEEGAEDVAADIIEDALRD